MSEAKTALIRRCDGCGFVTAMDLENTLRHKRDMQRRGQTVYEVTEAKALRSWAPCKVGCRCETKAEQGGAA